MPTPIWKGSTALIEQPNSPRWTFGEQIELVRTLKGQYAVCLQSAPGFGAIGTGVAAGLRVRESTVTRERGSIGVLTIAFAPFRNQPSENIPLPEDTEEMMTSITSEDHIQSVRSKGGADFGFAFGELARFRCSVFKERGNFALVLRQIPSKLLTIDQIGLSHTLVRDLLNKPRGLILVTGPTGSGKSTTLASMINILNETRDEAHIITIEDPIEFYHKHKKAVITQREVSVDVPSFAEAIRRALRQDPDVILVGFASLIPQG